MKKQMKNTKKLLLLSFTAIALSNCDFCALGKIENQTNDTIKIVCIRTTEAPSTFHAKDVTKEYNEKTGGYFFGINQNENEERYHQLNDSTVYIDIAPKSTFNIRIGMNLTWSEERIQTYLRYIKRMEIRTSNNTLVYNGGKQLNNLFLENMASNKGIQINIEK